jgi:hypothetical protein
MRTNKDSIFGGMSLESLLVAYKDARRLELDKRFILMLQAEIVERSMRIQENGENED